MFVSMEDYLRIVNCNSSPHRADTDSVSKSVTPQSTHFVYTETLMTLMTHDDYGYDVCQCCGGD